MTSNSSLREARDLYELKEKAAKYYAENGVPQKMEEILNNMFYDNPSDVYGHLANYFQEFASCPTITKIKARAALDSKAHTAIQTEVYCTVNNKEQLVYTSLSSSTSPHVLEVGRPEDRDEEDREREENIKAAIKYINSDISPKLKGLDPTKQEESDPIVRKLVAELQTAEEERLAKEAEERGAEGNEELEKKSSSAVSKPKSSKGKAGKGGAPVVVVPDEPREKMLCGSNCISAVSQALCCAGAATMNIPPFEYIARLRFNQVPSEFRLPLPMVTILQSGRSAPGKSNCVKEYMVVPKPGRPLRESLPQIQNIYNHIIKTILNKNGVAAKNVTDTGALMLPFDRPEQGLDMIQEAITHYELTPGEDFYIALNLAGHEIFDYEKGKYEVITGQQKVADDVVEYWADLLGRYPAVIAIIDPLRKQEDRQWMSLCERISERCYILGSRAYHRPGLLKDEELIDSFKTSGVVYKLEQMNTVTDLLDCAKKMEEAENQTVISANIGETTDTFLADLAVGMNARFIKLGAPCRGERVAKLNRLLAIEEQLEEQGKLAYHSMFEFPVITIPPPPEPEGGEEEGQEEVKETPRKGK